MDEFLLRMPSTTRRAVANTPVNPFLPAFAEAFAEVPASDGYVAIGLSDLNIRRGDIVHDAHCRQAAQDLPTLPDVLGGYRPRPVRDYFGPGRLADDLSNPVTGMLSAGTIPDLAALITAKSSGFMITYGAHGHFVRAWGGHCDNYAESEMVGLIEGIERICCADPDPAQIVTELGPDTRVVGLGELGVASQPAHDTRPAVTHWSGGTDLISGEDVALPVRAVYYDARISDPSYVQDSSSGCAAGGSSDEARLFGLLEVIERDAFLLAWYGDLELRMIEPGSITDPESRAYVQRLQLVGRSVRFFDATVGVEVPTVIAVCDTASGGMCFGAGSHPDPERALRSALVEVASDFQVIEDHLAHRRHELELMLADVHRVRQVDDHADLYGHPDSRTFLTGWARDAATERTIPLTQLRRAVDAGQSITSDLSSVLAAVHSAGFSPISVDVSSSLSRRHGLSCVKVVVPGLLPLDFGWANQRAMRMQRLSERARVIHPFPHPFP